MKFSLLSAIALFAAAATAQTNNAVADIDDRARSLKEDAARVDDSVLNRECHKQNDNYIPSLKAGEYSTSAFHNCFRTVDQIYEFTDALVAQNPKLLSKFAISKSYKNATIYGYKLTKGHSQSLYFQALQHAREWIAGSSILYSLASILDDIANNKPTAADEYDLYFVPIVNIDSYALTWNGKRFQRKNANEVDLNRNWPTPFENPKPPAKKHEIYPGLKPFSEPETAGINEWLLSKRGEIQGFIDIHAYGALILYAYADTREPLGGGFDEKFDVLGRGLKSVMGAYTSKPAHGFYLAYGVFPDYAFREFKKPALTIEIIGDDFTANVTTIPTRGLEVYKGINQFAKEVTVFNGGDVKPSCGK
ncbi:hypothetical protein H257_14282 [Aphanomyces astaci]|uniref:Peptidase M14 domain-containing protein n=2 Tax=Aphanomyces astaci TaxID=112090 RepID=W4FT66_APHAT|nr:hypothetical protein H257_14281 [Aphanomyces astaci]XP_009840353.1 hypothetical protein H257_14282 [Aphanomyces astaci]ETV70121.1 hypothetical protein H257_14281 [Aphanomyces astaci]ETV70122.1 hypothetical protein H257_14282 [Aphanomyces astaci]|eukprot:XP_009840352.1 hypothetical protein H257_14281 [Aphanomyces astaci]